MKQDLINNELILKGVEYLENNNLINECIEYKFTENDIIEEKIYCLDEFELIKDNIEKNINIVWGLNDIVNFMFLLWFSCLYLSFIKIY
jgi:hypothetical protein